MEPLLGQIQAFAYSWAPQGWLSCEGQLLPINTNTALFSLLGTTYGGDGMTNFQLPDLRSLGEAQQLHYCIAVVGVYPSRP